MIQHCYDNQSTWNRSAVATRATCVVRLESWRGRSCVGTIVMISLVAGIGVMVRSIVGGIPAEEELVDAEGKQQKHSNHQEVSRMIIF